jgi:hypothetical protein
MDYKLAQSLLDMLVRNCPVDSGALKQSISIVQYSEKEFVIQIGNESGKEINGSSATNVYAAITNQRYLKHRVKGTYLNALKPNPNYHWVNNAIDKWITANRLNLSVMTDEEEEEIENGEI